MAGWDGAGNFVLNYSYVAEAAAGVKILASHQDTQWATIQAGIMNCLARDGQNSPSADIPFNTKKITNLGNPASAQDAATKAYVDAQTYAEWVPEFVSFAWGSATTFKILGVDATARYTTGRRVKILHNTGGTLSYGTVLSSAFGTDTTVTVIMDAGVALVNTVTGLAFGLLSYINPSFIPSATVVQASASATQTVAALATKILWNAKSIDVLSEMDVVTNNRFTAKYGGYYLVQAQMQVIANTSQTGSFSIYKNGGASIFTQNITYPVGVAALATLTGIVGLNATEYAEIFFQMGAGAGHTLNASMNGTLNISRVGTK